MARAKYSYNEQHPYLFVQIKCPGCDQEHFISIHSIPEEPERPVWGFNNNFSKPTFTPSILVKYGIFVEGDKYKERLPISDWDWYVASSGVCHSFITDGRIQFLGDCAHKLANQTVDLPDLY